MRRQDISHVDPLKGIPPWRESQAQVGNEDDKDLVHNLRASTGRAVPHQVPGKRSQSCSFEPTAGAIRDTVSQDCQFRTSGEEGRNAQEFAPSNNDDLRLDRQSELFNFN